MTTTDKAHSTRTTTPDPQPGINALQTRARFSSSLRSHPSPATWTSSARRAATWRSSCGLSRLAGRVHVVDERHGFRYFDDRDLTGFVDGTENPTGTARIEATVVGREDVAFAGGSYVMVQKYLHDHARWYALTTEVQERSEERRVGKE